MIIKKKLLIWGTGEDATKLIYRYPIINIFVDRFIDSNKSKKIFYGREVVHPDDIDWNEPLFIIIATRKFYREIELILNAKSLKFGINYTNYFIAWYQWISSFENDIFIKKLYVLEDRIKQFDKWIPNLLSKLIYNKEMIKDYIYGNISSVEEAILKSCSNETDRIIELVGNVFFEYNCMQELVIIFEELLIHEDYYFHTTNTTPLIIDAGANVGLAIFYFKTLYPNANIIAFEPMPLLYHIMMRNIERNHWNNVQVYPFAISDVKEECIFYVQNSGLAGSLEKRNQEGVNLKEIFEIKVQSVCLSSYMDKMVDYLKMDIEGSETKVIKEIEHQLKSVNHIFIEFHEGNMKGNNSIGEILNILEKQGFCVNISKSIGSTKKSNYKPMKQVGNRVSEVIWAKRL